MLSYRCLGVHVRDRQFTGNGPQVITYSGGSRPSDNGGPGHLDTEIGAVLRASVWSKNKDLTYSGGSRPSDNGGPGHLDTEIGAVLRASVWSKIKGGAPPGSLPCIRH